MSDYPYVWTWGQGPMRALDRKGQRCRVLARGTMNSALLEFPDGFRTVTSRNGLRRAADSPLPAQLDLDGRAHEIAPAHERPRLFEPAPTQLAGQQGLSITERDEEP